MKSNVLELKALIEQLRRSDPTFRVFGSSSHRYLVGPTLSEREILAFEKKHKLTLPEDYRLYLRLVGNGNGCSQQPFPHKSANLVAGAGPGYGVYGLFDLAHGDELGQPFPFAEKVDLPDAEPYNLWDNFVPGALEINTWGCCSHAHLIVNGAEFGTVWEGFDYEHFAPTNLTFTEWMRDWAEQALSILATEPLIDKLTVGMTQAQVAAVVGGEWQRKKNSDRCEYYLAAPGAAAQLILSEENGVVAKINRSSSLYVPSAVRNST